MADRRASSNFPRIENGTLGLDVETTGLSWKKDKIFGFAVAVSPQESWYYDIRECPQAFEWLQDTIGRVDRVINHSIKFDAHFLENEGVTIPDSKLQCTLVRACLIDEYERSYSLDSLGKKYVGREKQSEIYAQLAQMFGGPPTRSHQIGNLHRAPANIVAPYARPDAEIAYQLWEWQEKEIVNQGLESIWGVEQRLTPVLIRMERRGVRVDVRKSHLALSGVNQRIRQCQVDLSKELGREFNPNSTPQVREYFKPAKRDEEWYVGSVQLEKTDSGAPSIGADALRQIDDPVARQILTYRKLDKARQFIEGHILGHQIDGFVYPNYNQTRGDNELGTRTGRLSVNDPALQQIPARDVEIGSIVRSLFVPRNKTKWLCADWEQFEFRWFAHYANSEPVNRIYEENPYADFHQTVAGLTGLPRSARFAGDANAKQINLGLVFGMGDGKLAQEMGLPYTIRRDEKRNKDILVPGPEARDVFARYHDAIPGVGALLQQASSIARSRGYVRTILGRHIRFPRGQFTHKAAGLVFQGSSADAMKLKLIELDAAGLDPILSVHDETDFEVEPGDINKPKLIRAILEDFHNDAIQCRIPIRANIKEGDNWWKASKEKSE